LRIRCTIVSSAADDTMVQRILKEMG